MNAEEKLIRECLALETHPYTREDARSNARLDRMARYWAKKDGTDLLPECEEIIGKPEEECSSVLFRTDGSCWLCNERHGEERDGRSGEFA